MEEMCPVLSDLFVKHFYMILSLLSDGLCMQDSGGFIYYYTFFLIIKISGNYIYIYVFIYLFIIGLFLWN